MLSLWKGRLEETLQQSSERELLCACEPPQREQLPLLTVSNGSRNNLHGCDKSSAAAIKKQSLLLFGLVPLHGLLKCYEYVQVQLLTW